MEIKKFEKSYQEKVIELWKECGLVVLQNDPEKDIHMKMEFQPEFYIAEIDGKLVGTIMIGYEGHRGWINYLAVKPMLQKKGIGRKLMEFAEIRLKEMGCPKINLQVRETNENVIKFYEKIGYKNDKVVSFGKRL